MVGASNVDVLDAAALEPVHVGSIDAGRNLANQAARIADGRVLSGLIADEGILAAVSAINAHVAHRNNSAIGASEHTAGAHARILVLPGSKHIYPRDNCRAARRDRFGGADVSVDRDIA